VGGSDSGAAGTGECSPPLTFKALSPVMVGRQPLWVGAADFDDDGAIDLATGNQRSQNVSVLFGNGDGTFEPADNLASGPGEYTGQGDAADLNGDGWTDLVVVNGNSLETVGLHSDGLNLFMNRGDRTFAPAARVPLQEQGLIAVTAADLSEDGLTDLVVATNNETVTVLLNQGDADFSTQKKYLSGPGTRAVAVGDVNGDQAPDLAVANGAGSSVSLLMNRGDGTFEAPVSYEVGLSPISLALVDLDADGDRDLAVAVFATDGVSVLLNNGDGAFTSSVSYGAGSSPYWLAVADFTGDSLADLVVANAGSQNVSLLVNRGGGAFLPSVEYPGGIGPVSVATADMNGDHSVDLAIADYNYGDGSVPMNGLIRVMLNECTGAR
jgi:hypothetical protein